MHVRREIILPFPQMLVAGNPNSTTDLCKCGRRGNPRITPQSASNGARRDLPSIDPTQSPPAEKHSPAVAT